MSTGLLTSYGLARYVAAEYDIVLGSDLAWRRDGTVPAVVYCHGATGSTYTAWNDAQERAYLRLLAQHFTVMVADLGGDTYGNDTAITRVGQAVTYLQAAASSGGWAAKAGKVLLTGNSMGMLTAGAYALANPANVAALAFTIPGLDLNDIVVNNRGGLASAVNAAYGGTYDNATHGPAHNPVSYAATLPTDLPIALWTSTNDTYAPSATADAFVAARPQTTRTSLGAVGHSTASINDTARTGMLNFLLANRPT